MNFDPRNILVINFGQLGDVVLSLPAMQAIRERFPKARITVAASKPGAEVVDLSGSADATLTVDRVALRYGFKLVSLARIAKLVKDVRRLQFDFVIDLHSLTETNLLGFLSGAPKRLYSRRPTRSIDFLANFKPRPPVEADHRQRHLIDRYLDVLIPLGVTSANRQPRLSTRAADDAAVEKILVKARAAAGAPLVGLFPGAGNPSRCWPLARFAELADFLVRNDHVRILVFVGPKEGALVQEIRDRFPPATVVLEKLTIAQMAAAQARLALFVSNDTGPMHIAAAVGTPVVLLMDKRAPATYSPQGERHKIVSNNIIGDIGVEEVYEAARAVLAGSRTSSLFAS